MNTFNLRTWLYLFLLFASFISCKKYLDQKTLKSQFIPDTLEDLQALLDNNKSVNVSGAGMLEIPADDYFVSSSVYESLLGYAADNSLNYIWAYNSLPHNNSWNLVYQGPIYYSNIVLDALPIISLEDKEKEYNSIKGSALFYRAVNFYDLAQLFCLPYGESNLNEPGIVLRLTSDINAKSNRATIKETYDKITSDLLESLELLPITTLYPTRPSKSAASAALARVYLSMGDYESAEKFAKKALLGRDTLMDFNSLLPNLPPRIKTFNPEVIFHNTIQTPPILASGNAKIDTTLIKKYETDDLRRELFFATSSEMDGTYTFQGSYDGNGDPTSLFNGTTSAEMLLIQAECRVRANDLLSAMKFLNRLLKSRWKTGTYIERAPSSLIEAKRLILDERRKELIFRGQRWGDLRRFNEEGDNITLVRFINGEQFVLPPKDKRWVMLIPFEVVNRSGISQNPR